MAIAFGAICGWIMWVATTGAIAIVTAVICGTLALLLVWRYGLFEIRVDESGLHAGRATLPHHFVGPAEVLDSSAFRDLLGPKADTRAYLATRPYVAQGIRVVVDDRNDPVPYWLISCRDPRRLVDALNSYRNSGDGSNSHLSPSSED